ncbi:MAG: 30S ribosomal protein S4 [Candidatus Yonathbacteria bacterium]|nr:30S ribosomal protein S4 [Candidatus Yonathbacteria bacterium]
MSTGHSKCKICRRAGEKLFLKGEKCFTPKCVFNKKPYAPGKLDSERKHRSQLTEYGRQLREKQKVRNMYGLREEQFSRYVKEATSHAGTNPAEMLYERLESRLDNVIFRLGIAASRPLARQMVSHGHITVNGRRVTIPSYRLKTGDALGVRDNSKQSKLFIDLGSKLAKQTYPTWLSFSPDVLKGEMKGAPKMEKSDTMFDLASVVEFYSR